MTIHIIQREQDVIESLQQVLKREGYEVLCHDSVEKAAPTIRNQDLIILDYSIVENMIDDALRKLCKKDERGLFTTRLIFLTGRPEDAEYLDKRLEVFRVVAKPVAQDQLLNLVKLSSDVAKLQWCIDEERVKPGTFYYLFSVLDIPILLVDISYRILYFNKAYKRINPNIEIGKICYRCIKFEKICSNCIVKRLFERERSIKQELQWRIVDRQRAYFHVTALPLKNEQSEVYASLVYYEESASVSMVTTDYKKRIKSILQAFTKYGFTRARYFEIERLAESFPDDDSNIKKWMMTAGPEIGGGVLEDFEGTRKAFNPREEGEQQETFRSSNTSRTYFIMETQKKSLWEDKVEMGNAPNWVKIIIRDKINGEEVPVALIAIDRRDDHLIESGAMIGISKKGTTDAREINDEDMEFLKEFYRVISDAICEAIRAKKQDQEIRDIKKIIEAENKIARAKDETEALKLMMDTCIHLTKASDANLILIRQDGKRLEKITGIGEFYKRWPKQIKIKDSALPCIHLVLTYQKDNNIKRLICQNTHEADNIHFKDKCKEGLKDVFEEQKDINEMMSLLEERQTYACFIIEHERRAVGTISLLFKNANAVSNYTVKMIENFISKAAPLLIIIQSREKLEGFTRKLIHETMAPVAYIHQSVERLIRESGQPETVKDIATCLCRETEFINFLIQNVRIAEDRMQFDLDSSINNPAKEIDYIIGLYQEYLDKDNKTVSFSSSRFPQNIRFDKNGFRLVISNLLSNAVNFTDPEGKIAINYSIQGGFLFIIFEDNGIGIPEGEEEIIFEKYKIGRNAFGRRQSTGIGLTTARKILKRQGGDIRVANRKDPTRFELRISLNPNPEE